MHTRLIHHHLYLMKKFPCIVFIMTLSINLYSQHATTGFVFDSETKEPLTGAYVIARSNQRGATTNANGHFTIQTSGVQDTLQVSFIGYDKHLFNVVVAISQGC